jgi:hypothetical protein
VVDRRHSQFAIDQGRQQPAERERVERLLAAVEADDDLLRHAAPPLIESDRTLPAPRRPLLPS